MTPSSLPHPSPADGGTLTASLVYLAACRSHVGGLWWRPVRLRRDLGPPSDEGPGPAMRLINRTLTNGDALAEPNARYWQGPEAWRIGIHHRVSPSAWAAW